MRRKAVVELAWSLPLPPKSESVQALARNAQTALQSVLDEHGLSAAWVTLTLTNDAEIRTLNREHRGLDQSTDVLSFPMYEPHEVQELIQTRSAAGQPMQGAMQGATQDEPPILLGDVVVSLETARRQAEDYGHTDTRELCFLSVHGGLHLLGYDHQNESGAAAMTAMTEQILAWQGLARG